MDSTNPTNLDSERNQIIIDLKSNHRWSGGQDSNLRHTGFCVSGAHLLFVCLIGWVTLHEAVEVYSVSVTMLDGGSEALPS